MSSQTLEARDRSSLVRDLSSKTMILEGPQSSLDPELANQIAQEKPGSARDVHGLSWFLIVCSVLSSTFLFGLDTTIVATIQPAVINRFDALPELPWLFTAFMLGAAATNLFWYVESELTVFNETHFSSGARRTLNSTPNGCTSHASFCSKSVRPSAARPRT